ncbi:MAG: putative DNA-binding domain-containing protein [Erythrobacter sp.]
MSLAARQQAFMAAILDDQAALPAGWDERQAAGLEIYRNNYRAALVAALAATFERTRRWVGQESFRRAAAHHVILHPPFSWTIDAVGHGFDATLAELFAVDCEVAELAALEWAMHRAFVAEDAASLTMADFATQTSGFSEDDWGRLGFVFVPGTALLKVVHDVGALWRALAVDDFAAPEIGLAAPHAMLVWREGLRPAFRLMEEADGEAMAIAIGGGTLGETCAALVARFGPDEGTTRAGRLLGQWVQDGLLAGLKA